MKRIAFALLTAFFVLSLTNCKNSKPDQTTEKSSTSENTTQLKSYVAIFEIPATDIDRAIKFYQATLDLKIEKMEIPGMEMGVLPYEGQAVTGVIMKGEGYVPSANGVTIYLDGGNNLQTILDKVEQNGGKVIFPKTQHADGNGYFALFIDSEGNKMGLNSPN